MICCYDFFLSDGKKIFLTNNCEKMTIRGASYAPHCDISIEKYTFNDSSNNLVEIAGVYSEKGISANHCFNNALVNIYVFNKGELIKEISNYYCCEHYKDNHGFKLYLKPLSRNFDSFVLEKYSPTCRAKFGDESCKVNLKSYSRCYKIKSIHANAIYIEDDAKHLSYAQGEALMKTDSSFFKANIKHHFKDLIELDRKIPSSDFKSVELTAGCDKQIHTCCEKFNNVVNFRGEPFIEHIFEILNRYEQ